MPQLGVIGTMVWDRIEGRDGRVTVAEEWGGIAYALAAMAAARPDPWEIVPIVKVGRDLSEQALRYMSALPGLDLDTGVRVVPEPNNRASLQYHDLERRCEWMSGGVPPWSWAELEPIICDLDALYINFISGFELDLTTATALRGGWRGPIYADLHSIFLGIDATTGLRLPQPLPRWAEWLRCFDFVQVNEEELGLLATAWNDPWRFAASVIGPDLRMLFVTLGAKGACYVAAGDAIDAPLAPSRGSGIVSPADVRSRKFDPPGGAVDGDPTGCGDVWGATCFCALLDGFAVDDAVGRALAAAAINVRHRGVTGLRSRLRGRLAP
ncbi:MAG: carbohydrate kinase family protein [Gemmatimonadetes bacterium]|nr:carbohydrate kinase family protein [Gemmatimonadota bacterium]